LKLLLENLGAEIIVATTADKDHQAYFSKEVEDIFQRVLLLAAAGSITKEKSLQTESEDEGILGSDCPFGISNVADACCAFLLYCIELLGPLKGVREACRLVLHQSKYLDPENEKTSDEMEALSKFFDKCVEVELSNTKQGGNKTQSEKKKDKLKLRQLYEKAVSVFRAIPPLADKYQQGRNDAFVL
jgi:hypothetical protein